MVTYTPKEEVLRILNGETIGYFPRAILFGTPTYDMMKVTGAHFPAGNYEGGPMAKLALANHELAGWNAVMLPWANCVEMEAFGCEVKNNPDNIVAYPQVKKKAFDDAYDVTVNGNILKKRPIPGILEATKIVRDTIETTYNGAIPVVSLTQGPFTIAGALIGESAMFKHMIKDVKRAMHVLDITSDVNIMVLNEMLRYGGDIAVVADPTAQGLTGKQFKEIVIPFYRKISKEVKSKVFVHICGKTSMIIPYLSESGFEAFSFDYPAVSVSEMKQAFKGEMKLIGSVPTITHLLEGSRDDVISVSHQLIDEGIDILAASCGLPQYTPLENVRAMADAIDIWNRERGVVFE
jgi:MtaA/CmuA family methyltransferase